MKRAQQNIPIAIGYVTQGNVYVRACLSADRNHLANYKQIKLITSPFLDRGYFGSTPPHFKVEWIDLKHKWIDLWDKLILQQVEFTHQEHNLILLFVPIIHLFAELILQISELI